MKPIHPRPFLLPETQKNRLLNLVENKQWAKQEFENLKQKADQGDGYSAAFLYALTNEKQYLEKAKSWLVNFAKNGADIGTRALEVKEEFFKQGMPWLGDVFYGTNTNYLEAFDYIHNGLSEAEKASILKGINASADFRQKSMDAWWQTANLVFKPTSMVAVAGLVTQNPRYLDWGFFRKPGSHVGGYFSALNTMLKDNGPWHEAPIYAVAHLPLYQSLKVSGFLTAMTGTDWFSQKLDGGSSVRGLMDYYINTTYPAEIRADGNRDYRILTYGDGATGQRGDLYLVNHNDLQPNLRDELTAAYKLSKNPDYAAFLKLYPDYQPDLIGTPELPVSPLPPEAQSSIWPDFGLAFLRSDNSRGYWTNPDAMAASLLFRQGYGHGHADALSITLFAAGQLFYPDYNAVQYENPAVGWTASSVAHNTVMVDANNSLIAENIQTKHEFGNEFGFVQAVVEEPLGLTKNRTLILTSDYLLDIFHHKSLTPRTYDYLLHSFGEIEVAETTTYSTSKPFSNRFKNISDFKTATHDDSWQLDFVIDSSRKQQNINRIIKQFVNQNNTESKLKQEFGLSGTGSLREAKLNFKMAGQPNTKVGIGEDKYGLSFLAARRENTKQTTYATLHSPSYLDQQQAQANNIQTLFESPQGILIKVTSDKYIDIHAISFQDGKTDLYDPANNLGMVFSNYSLVRIDKSDQQVITHGELDSYFIPENLAESKQDLHKGTYQIPPTHINQDTGPLLQVNVFPEILVLKDFADSTFTLSLTNTTDQPVSAKITIPANPNFTVPRNEYLLKGIPAYQTVHQKVTLGRYKQTTSPDMLPLLISINDSNELIEHGIMINIGPGLRRQFEHLQEPVYRIHTFDSIIDITMRHGLVNRITDNNTEVMFNAASLFHLSDGKTVFSPENNAIKKSFTWANENHASVISEINNLVRWHMLAIQNRIYLRLDEVYTRLEEVFFVIDKNHEIFNWHDAEYLSQGSLKLLFQSNAEDFSTNAIEIPFTGSGKSLCIKTSNMKNWLNRNKNLSFSLTRDYNDQFSFGLCDRGSLITWAN